MTAEQKEIVMTLLNNGICQRNIAELVGINQATVSKFKKRIVIRGFAENKSRSGRKEMTCARGDGL